MIIQPQAGLVSKREGDYGIDASPTWGWEMHSLITQGSLHYIAATLG